MMDVRTIEIGGFAGMLTALHLPFTAKVKSTIESAQWLTGATPEVFCSDVRIEVDSRDIQLASTLIARGDEHAKALRGIVVWAKVEAPIYWWCELETYRAGHERLSSESTMHKDCRGLSGDELVEAKSNIPMGKTLTKVDYFSYQCLRNIYRQRKGHRLPEWKVFLDWIESLPYAEELILVGLGNDTEKL